MENLPPPIDTTPAFTPVAPPPGSPDATRRVGAPVAAEPPAPQSLPPLIAALDFGDAQRTRDVPLAFPPVWEGRRIETVTVRRLLTCEVAALVPNGKLPDVFEVYAVMAGLPAPVLRGLDADDGQAVAEAAFDFLPRLLKAAYSG